MSFSTFPTSPVVRILSWIKRNLTMSPLIFSWGKVTVGTSQPKNSHNGFQPCFTLYTNSFSGGTSDLTRWLCMRYRLRETQVDLRFAEPRIALIWGYRTRSIFLAVGDNSTRKKLLDLSTSRSSRWFSKPFCQEKLPVFPPRRSFQESQRLHQHFGRLSEHLAGRHFDKHRPSGPKNPTSALLNQWPWIQGIVKLWRWI